MDTKLVERQQELVHALANELAGVVGALLGGTAAAAPAAGAVVPGWLVVCAMSGSQAGRLTIAISEKDAATLAQRLMGMADAPEDDAVADTVAEVAGQAAGGLSQQAVAAGSKLRVEGAPARGGTAPAAQGGAFDVTTDDGTVFRFACWAELEAPQAAASGPGVERAAVAPAPAPVPASSAAPDNLDVILDIELPLTVRFGRAEMSLQALTKIGPGSVIDLDRSPDEPVEVLVNDKVIARGEVVVVAGNYGVRITEVASPADRIRTLG